MGTCCRGICVVGADEGVGKTLVAAGLARLMRRRGHRVAVFKPFLCGDPHGQDAQILARAAGIAGPGPLPTTLLDVVSPVRFDDRTAPGIAARRAHQPVDLDALVEDARALGNANEVLVVEGTGGLMLPVTTDLRGTILDLVERLALPTVLVARTAHTAISHSVLAVKALQQRGITCSTVVLCQVDPGHEQEDPLIGDAIAALSGIRPRVTLPYFTGSEAIRVGSAARTFEEHEMWDLFEPRR